MAPGLYRFEGSIPPRRIPLTYRVTLALSAFAMVLLPLVYVALIFATAYGVYLWATFGLLVFQDSGGGFMKLLIYASPLFAGVTLIAFMIKPLFAKPAKRPEPFTLDLLQYPELKHLIASICSKVGAPMPVRVDVDCQVNASAHLRRGLLSLGRGDLVLTIGLPLVNGLTARQLAGVLAHEFGHFAQGAGMAFTFVIRSINAWFARVVFERDQWDANLTTWTEQGDFRIRLVVGLARGAVWLSRRILHGLMVVGHAITCLQLRQMEYDADYYEVQLVGGEDFAATAREISRLAAASSVAFDDLGELWRTRQLVENLPDLIAVKRASFVPEMLAKIDGHVTSTKTSWFDTHPSNAARDAAARQLGLSGILHCDAPARALFPNLDEVARAATRHFYRGQGLVVDDSALVSTEHAQRAGATAAASDAARDRLVGNILDLTRPLVWRQSDFTPSDELTGEKLARDLGTQRSEMAQLRLKAAQETTTYSNIQEHLLLCDQAHALLTAGVKVTPRTFLLAKSDLTEATQRRAELTTRLAAKASDIKPFESAFHRWVILVGQAARCGRHITGCPDEMREELVRLTTSLAALTPWFSAFPDWHRQHMVLAAFAANHKTLSSDEKFMSAFRAHFNAATHAGDQALTLVGEAPVALSTSNGTISAATLLRNALEGVEGADRLVTVMQTAAGAYFRILSRIVALGEDLEAKLSAPTAPAISTP